MTDWAIPQQAKLKYTQLFNLHDRSRSGFLSGLQCRDILLQSGLPRNILAEIWNLSDIDGDGQLTREEFILAMHLTNHVRSGNTLPNELSADLIPPSYRRTRSISATSVHSAGSSVSGSGIAAGSFAASSATATTLQDDQVSQKSSEAGSVLAGSVLNSHSFEDKRRENFEKGRAELERRRLKMIEQQTSVLNEQLTACKKQVAEAKAKIDKMRSERDTKAGLITSLEAQLQTVRDRKAYLDHEEVGLIAIAKDLNLVNSAHSIELDQQATKAKQESINQMKENLIDLQKEKEEKATKLTEASQRLEESKKEFKSVSEEAGKTYETYREKVTKAKLMRQQFLEENKNKTVDLDSAWDSAPSFTPTQAQPATTSTNNATTTTTTTTRVESTPTPFGGASDDPWTTATTTTTSTTITNNNNDAKVSSEPFAFNDAITTATNNNFEPARDYSALTSLDSKSVGQQSPSSKLNEFNEKNIGDIGVAKRKYRALYAFEARNVDELTINPGDIIIGTEVVCEPGWLSGESSGRSGLFPEAYVELLPAEPVGESTLVSGARNSSKSSNQSASSTVIGSSSIAAPQADPFSISKVKYKVIYEFDARNPDELTIKPGDMIVGVEGPHEPGWLMGEMNGRKGLFPEAYVEKMATDLAQQQQQQQHSEQTTEQTTGKSRAKKAEVATVIANYRALGQEQLNLEKGQLVSIRRKMDSGWWEGELQIKAQPNPIQRATDNDKHKQQIHSRRNELDNLIDELVSSEWDFVNDLRLCQSAYIFPLSSSFDVSHIFTNWNQLIQVHETSLTNLSNYLSGHNHGRRRHRRSLADYTFIFETFQNLFNSIVDLYVDYCSHQNESTKQLEVKLGGDIRFRQLVNESQRKLKKLLDQQKQQQNSNGIKLTSENNDYLLDSGQHSRALRNSNLPLTSFLIKPMQRITKYSLIFDRILKTISQNNRELENLQNQVAKLKVAADQLCKQVNEACRVKEDDEGNKIKLRWCQNHIKQSQQLVEQQQANIISKELDATTTTTTTRQISMTSNDLNDSVHSSISQQISNKHTELIIFNSATNCLGPRRLIRAASLIKVKASARELVGFLFNDLLLLTQIKGGLSLRVEDVFKSERAQQAYYKPYKLPILLEDLHMQAFDEESVSNITCSSINSSNMSDHEDKIISFLDRYNGISYNLMALSSKERAEWVRQLDQRSHEAREARAFSQTSARFSRPLRRLSSSECLGRLFVTVVELDRIALGQCTSSPQLMNATSSDHSLNSSWERRLSLTSGSLCLNPSAQNVCLKLQLRRYKRNSGADKEEDRQVIPLSDEFKTRSIATHHLGETEIRSPGSFADQFDSTFNGSPRHNNHMIRLEDDCTQFMIPSKLIGLDYADYLELELMEDSRFKETKLIARKRINIDQLLGRDSTARRQALDSTSGIQSITPRQSMRGTSTTYQVIQPNRPVEMIFKLKPIRTISSNNKSPSKSSSSYEQYYAQAHNQPKLAVKLRLHLQLFRDDINS